MLSWSAGDKRLGNDGTGANCFRRQCSRVGTWRLLLRLSGLNTQADGFDGNSWRNHTPSSRLLLAALAYKTPRLLFGRAAFEIESQESKKTPNVKTCGTPHEEAVDMVKALGQHSCSLYRSPRTPISSVSAGTETTEGDHPLGPNTRPKRGQDWEPGRDGPASIKPSWQQYR